MAKVFAIDVAKCNGCFNCQLACKDENVANDWTPYSKPQPETGHFWVKLLENVRGKRPKVRIHYVATLCNHCDKPMCAAVCPSEAFIKRDDGLIILSPERCTGCKKCIDACPYGAIYFNGELNIAQKCTGCAHLLDHGYKLPRCVEACPTDALLFGEEAELAGFINGADVIMSETGCAPRVYYRNIPGRFIAGTVYDPVDEEVLIGAKCLLACGGIIRETYTDSYGDFWFRDLPVGKYDLTISAAGYESKDWVGLDNSEDIVLGDVPMDKI